MAFPFPASSLSTQPPSPGSSVLSISSIFLDSYVNSKQEKKKKKPSRHKCLSSPKARKPGVLLALSSTEARSQRSMPGGPGGSLLSGGPQGGMSAECFGWLGLTASFPLPSWVPVASCYRNFPYCGAEWVGDDFNWSPGSPLPPLASYQS